MMHMLQKTQMMRQMSPHMYEETEEPSDEEEINELASGEKQFQDTNNSDESNHDTDAESEEQGKRLLLEDKGTDKRKTKEMMKMRKRNEMIRMKRKRKMMRETQIA